MAEPAHGPTHGRAALLLLSIFVLGLICGAALLHVGHGSVGGDRGERRSHRGGMPPGVHPIEFLVEHLELDEEQLQQIHEIMDRHREAFFDEFEETRREVHGLLRPDQLARFEELHHLRRRMHHRDPPAGDPHSRPRFRRPAPAPAEPEGSDE